MLGFCSIIREENDIKVKNAMLDYTTDMMEDAQDFGWPSAKWAHAVILCRMEKGMVNWLMSDKLDILNRAHIEKVITNPSTLKGPKLRWTAKVCPANFSKQVNVHTKMIIPLVVNCTSIFVPIVPP